MGWVKKSVLLFTIFGLSFSQVVNAGETVSKSAMGNSPNVYLQAFYAAMATLLIMSILWLVIFRPKFKSTNE